MLLMVEESIRGGITQAVHINCKANNKYMDKKYNKEKNQNIFSIMMLIAYMHG